MIDCSSITRIGSSTDDARRPLPPPHAAVRRRVPGASRPPEPPRARPRPPVLRSHAVFVLRGRASPCMRGERRPPPCHARSLRPSAVHARPAASGFANAWCVPLSAARVGVLPYTAEGERSSLRCLRTPVARSQSLPRSERHGPKKRNFRGRAARTAARDRRLATQLATQLRSSTTLDAKGPTWPAHAPAREHARRSPRHSGAGGPPRSRRAPPVAGRARRFSEAAPRHAPSRNFRSPLAVAPATSDGLSAASGLQTPPSRVAGGVWSGGPLA